LKGKKFGRLTVIDRYLGKKSRKAYWKCVCDCGNIKVVRSDGLQNANTRSCGCLKAEQDKENLTTHHRHLESKTDLHNKWLGIKARCLNPQNKRYADYGARGIGICKEWSDSYEAFREWALSSEYKEGLTIERINVNGNYTPENCKWIPMNQQANNRRSTVWIEYNGKKKSLMEWSKELGIKYGTLHSRHYRSKMKPPELFKNETTPR
jgi:hypothetical protein